MKELQYKPSTVIAKNSVVRAGTGNVPIKNVLVISIGDDFEGGTERSKVNSFLLIASRVDNAHGFGLGGVANHCKVPCQLKGDALGAAALFDFDENFAQDPIRCGVQKAFDG